jgi:hypothetical protein
MIRAFALDEGALSFLAEIVHDIDLGDGRYHRPETPGVDAILHGWLQTNLSDAYLETQGIALFNGLYSSLTKQTPYGS